MKIEVGISTLLHPAAAHCEVEHTVAKTTQTPENTQTLREQSMLSIMHVSGEVPRGGGSLAGEATLRKAVIGRLRSVRPTHKCGAATATAAPIWNMIGC